MSRRTRRRQEITRALDLGAGVSVDLEPDRDLDDDRRLPLHSKFPPAEFRARQTKVEVTSCQQLMTGPLCRAPHLSSAPVSRRSSAASEHRESAGAERGSRIFGQGRVRPSMMPIFKAAASAAAPAAAYPRIRSKACAE